MAEILPSPNHARPRSLSLGTARPFHFWEQRGHANSGRRRTFVTVRVSGRTVACCYWFCRLRCIRVTGCRQFRGPWALLLENELCQAFLVRNGYQHLAASSTEETSLHRQCERVTRRFQGQESRRRFSASECIDVSLPKRVKTCPESRVGEKEETASLRQAVWGKQRERPTAL